MEFVTLFIADEQLRHYNPIIPILKYIILNEEDQNGLTQELNTTSW